MSVSALLTKLEQGSYSFAELSPEEQATMGQALRPPAGGFSLAQQALLNGWYLVVSDPAPLAAAIATRNATGGLRLGLSTRATIDGREVLPASLLTDCRPGETWAAVASELYQLKFVKLTAADFPPPEEL